MSEHLSPDLEQLLAAERAAPPAPVEAQRAVFDRVAETVGIGGAASGGSAVAAAKLAWSTKLIIVGVIGMVAVGAITAWLSVREAEIAVRAEPAEAPAVARAELPGGVFAAAEAEPDPESTATTGVGPAEDETAPTDRLRELDKRAAALDHKTDLDKERRILSAAREALVAGDIDRALRALESHSVLFLRGQLAEEREALLVQALVVAGNASRARERADMFRARYPDSIQLRAVDAALERLQ